MGVPPTLQLVLEFENISFSQHELEFIKNKISSIFMARSIFYRASAPRDKCPVKLVVVDELNINTAV